MNYERIGLIFSEQLKAASVLFKMATVGNAYHTLLQQVKTCEHKRRRKIENMNSFESMLTRVKTCENMQKIVNNKVKHETFDNT